MASFPQRVDTDLAVAGDITATQNIALTDGAAIGHLPVIQATDGMDITYAMRGSVIAIQASGGPVAVNLPDLTTLPTNFVTYRVRNEFSPHPLVLQSQNGQLIGTGVQGNPFQQYVNLDDEIELVGIKGPLPRWFIASKQFDEWFPEQRSSPPPFGGVAATNRLYSLTPDAPFEITLPAVDTCRGQEVAFYAQSVDADKPVTIRAGPGERINGYWWKGRLRNAPEVVIDEPDHVLLLTASLQGEWLANGTGDGRWVPSTDQVVAGRSWRILKTGETVSLPSTTANVGYEIAIQTERLDDDDQARVVCEESDRLVGFVVDVYLRPGDNAKAVAFKESDHTIIFTANNQNQWVARTTPPVQEGGGGSGWTHQQTDAAAISAAANTWYDVTRQTTVTLPESRTVQGQEIALFTNATNASAPLTIRPTGADDIFGYVIGQIFTPLAPAPVSGIRVTDVAHTIIFTAGDGAWMARSTPQPPRLLVRFIDDRDLTNVVISPTTSVFNAFPLQAGWFYQMFVGKNLSPAPRYVLPPSAENLGREVTIYCIPGTVGEQIRISTRYDNTAIFDLFEGGYTELVDATINGNAEKIPVSRLYDSNQVNTTFTLQEGRTVTFIADQGFWYIKSIL